MATTTDRTTTSGARLVRGPSLPRVVPGLLLSLLLACSGGDAAAPGDATSCELQWVGGGRSPGPELDLVLVVSDAPAMAPLAERVPVELRRIANALALLEGGLPSLHVATVGPGGLHGGAATAGCPALPAAWLADVAVPWFWCPEVAAPGSGCRVRNYDGDWPTALACLGATPPDGAPAPPVLARLVDALDPARPEVAAFRRPGAWLMILVIDAEDDASPLAATAYAEALRRDADDPSRVIVGVVADLGAPRLRAFADAFPNRNAMVSIVADDWTDVVAVATPFGLGIVDDCLAEAGPDVAPDQPGRQLDCVVTDGWSEASRAADGAPIPRCTMAAAGRPAADTPLPCYWIAPGFADYPECAARLVIERATDDPALAWARCACALDPA
ncbi:MAG: hypothetical protein H6709_18050 [Kofleriaceae bacterium]|nr:hypothetical protein [Kofleriaceae bacterium]MCB9573988.1 hypothetical protein [Kofleriaceae bacterium]